MVADVDMTTLDMDYLFLLTYSSIFEVNDWSTSLSLSGLISKGYITLLPIHGVSDVIYTNSLAWASSTMVSYKTDDSAAELADFLVR